jgi:hypothetical protein
MKNEENNKNYESILLERLETKIDAIIEGQKITDTKVDLLADNLGIVKQDVEFLKDDMDFVKSETIEIRNRFKEEEAESEMIVDHEKRIGVLEKTSLSSI